MLNCNNNEIWKDCVGYEGRYQVSNLGNVRSIANNKGTYQERLLSQRQTTTSDYLYVNFTVKDVPTRHSVHRLVAKAFIANPSNKATVNHIDGNKLNNNVCNLEWNTYSENLKHAFATGLNKPSRSALGRKLGNNTKNIYVDYNQSRHRFKA